MPCAHVDHGRESVIDGARRVGQRADHHRPEQPRHRRWAGGLLVLAGLAAVLAILLPRLGATPAAGPPGGRPAASTPNTSNRAAQPAAGLPCKATRTPQDAGEEDWSPDGNRIAYTSSAAGGHDREQRPSPRIWVRCADGSDVRQLTDDPGFAPDWAPDGTRILYIGGDYRLYVINADGTGRQRIGKVRPIRSARWSPDGTRIALTMADAVWIINADGTGLHRIRQSASDPSWTPDGRHLVFTAYGSGTTPPELHRIDVDGRNEIPLRP
jgi:Tol biopolymer transport system component